MRCSPSWLRYSEGLPPGGALELGEEFGRGNFGVVRAARLVHPSVGYLSSEAAAQAPGQSCVAKVAESARAHSYYLSKQVQEHG